MRPLTTTGTPPTIDLLTQLCWRTLAAVPGRPLLTAASSPSPSPHHPAGPKFPPMARPSGHGAVAVLCVRRRLTVVATAALVSFTANAVSPPSFPLVTFLQASPEQWGWAVEGGGR